MDIWIQRIFLGLYLVTISLFAATANAADELADPVSNSEQSLTQEASEDSTEQLAEQPVSVIEEEDLIDKDLDLPEDARTQPALRAVELIDPKVKRQQIDIAAIDSLDVEIGLFGGVMSVEDFGVNIVEGLFLNYHVTEDIFVAASYGQTTTERTSFERLSGVDLLTDDQRELQYYDLSVGLNLLPGEGFIGNLWSFNSAFYATLGVGSTDFAGDQRFTIAWSAGYKMIILDYLTLHVELEEHLFDIDILGATKISDNLSLQAGFSVYF